MKRFINSNEFGRMSLQQPTRGTHVEDLILQIVCELFADSRVRKVGFPDILDSGLAAGQLQSQIRGMHAWMDCVYMVPLFMVLQVVMIPAHMDTKSE